MRIYLASDHAGWDMKQTLAAFLKERGFDIVDFSAGAPDPADDYPDSALALGEAVRENPDTRGILICGSGVGASVAVNKVKGIRGGLCHDTYSAHQSVEHDNANVLVLGSRIIGIELAKELATTFLHAVFSGEARHVRRLAKVKAMEDNF